jgi:hypothetical protein
LILKTKRGENVKISGEVMKKNRVVLLAALVTASNLPATVFFNETSNNIRILEHAGKKYNLRGKPEEGVAGLQRLELGLRDDLAIQIVGGPELHFNLRAIKQNFQTVQKAVLNFYEQGGYSLHLEGLPTGNKNAAFNKLAGICDLKERKPRCWVRFGARKEHLVVEGIKPENREAGVKKAKNRRARG